PGSEYRVVQSVSPDEQSGLWIGYHANLVEHWTNGVSGKFAVVQDGDYASGVSARAVFVDKNGRTFAGISGFPRPRLFEFKSDKFSPSPGNDVSTDVSAIHQDRSGRLWIGTQGGLVLIEGQNNKVFSVAEGLPSSDVRAIVDDAEGNIWIGTGAGL